MNTVPRTGEATSAGVRLGARGPSQLQGQAAPQAGARLSHRRQLDDVLEGAFRRQSSEPTYTSSKAEEQRRNKLVSCIDREIRLRDGAENLYKATRNKQLRHSIAQELSYMNSSIQLLKEELSASQDGLDSTQAEGLLECVPMIPLTLKETRDVSLEPLEMYISEHYHEDGSAYANELATLLQMRQACRDPSGCEEGLSCMFEYCNQLNYVEKRFQHPTKSLPVQFHWYDSLTGVPAVQGSVSFEKGSLLYNIGALYTQIAASHNRSSETDAEFAAQSFCRAAGAFKFLHDNFSHAPTVDMQLEVLDMLIQLVLSQAQECKFEKLTVDGTDEGMKAQVQVAHEASKVSDMYKRTSTLMRAEMVKHYIPQTWATMVEVKHLYYKALAHYHTAAALVDHADSQSAEQLSDVFQDLHVGRPAKLAVLVPVPTTPQGNASIARCHFRQSVILHEDAMRQNHGNTEHRRVDSFHRVIKKTHDLALHKLGLVEDEDDFSEPNVLPAIKGFSSEEAAPVVPDFAKYKVADIFFRLGPLNVFCAKNEWSAPKVVTLNKAEGQEFGFSIRGDSPPVIADVEEGSLAQGAGIARGDIVLAVGSRDVKWSKHEEVVRLIKAEGAALSLTLATPSENNAAGKQSPNGTAGERGRKPGTPGERSGKKKEKKRFSLSLTRKKKLSPAAIGQMV